MIRRAISIILAMAITLCALSSIAATSKKTSESKQQFDTAYSALEFISSRDYKNLSKLVHPKKGLSFLPYVFTEKGYKTFTAAQVKALSKDNNVYTWGEYDGSGEPIKLTAAKYFEKFVYNKKYIDAELVGINNAFAQGNATDSALKKYAKAKFVEFYIEDPDPDNGMDWGSLRVVMEKYDGKYYIIALVHGQWTI